jgi:hypothetical protein
LDYRIGSTVAGVRAGGAAAEKPGQGKREPTNTGDRV